MVDEVSKYNNRKKEWKKFYNIKDELLGLLFNNTEVLNDSSSKYTRCICFTEDKELLEKIELLGKELNIQYKIASEDIKDCREIPVILNDVENIIINSYESYSSYKYEKGSRLSSVGTVQVSYVSLLEDFWGKNYEKNLKKYKLLENREKNRVSMKMEDILELASAKVIQKRTPTGLRYTLNIRKVGETLSKRYKYGIMIIDKKAAVSFANKEAKRKHSLEVSGERVEFPFPTVLDCDLFIKEKN